MTKIRLFFALLATLVSTVTALAQPQHDPELTTYLNQVQQTYEMGNQEELKALFTYEGQSTWLDRIQSLEPSRQQGSSTIIEANEDSATVLMFFKAAVSHPYVATMLQSELSGFYKLRKDSVWHIADKVAIDRANRIRQHGLNIVIDPGVAMQVVDTLLIDVGDPLGFWMILNSKANVTQVIFQGEEVDFTFQSGLLWMDKTNIQGGELIITYSLDTAAFNTAEQIRFAKENAYLRQNFWHPMLKYGSTKDIADFSITVQIPAEYQLSTSFPVTSSVQDGIRYIRSESTYPAADIALLYDNAWEVEQREYSPMTFEIFATSDYIPQKNNLFNTLKETYDFLVSKFGKCLGNYFGAAQSRLLKGNYWSAKNNSIVISAENGGDAIFKEPVPRAVVAHEMSHAWTQPTGPARLFLMEGWAMFVETYFIRRAYGDSTTQVFWQIRRKRYFDNHDSNVSLWEDENNSGISYEKGAWVLKIMRDQLGEKVFEQGFKNYVQNTITPDKDIHAFAKSMSAAASSDVWPMLETWLKSQHVPEIKAYVSDGQLVIEQTGEDTFQFPLEIRLETARETITRTFTIDKKINRFPLGQAEEINAILVDPHHKMLMTVRK